MGKFIEPVKDYRGKSWWNIFPVRGQVSFTHNYKGTIRAFHRHKNQTDYWFCVYGEARVKLDGEDFYISQGNYLKIEPGTWHGLEALTDCGIVYYTDKKYNHKNPDEERLNWDNWDWRKEWK